MVTAYCIGSQTEFLSPITIQAFNSLVFNFTGFCNRIFADSRFLQLSLHRSFRWIASIWCPLNLKWKKMLVSNLLSSITWDILSIVNSCQCVSALAQSLLLFVFKHMQTEMLKRKENPPPGITLFLHYLKIHSIH